MSTVNELQLMTKKRLQNLRRRSLGLQQLAVREISKQLTFYRTHPDELEKLESLPGVLRDKILQYLMKRKCFDEQGRKTEFENLKEIFPLLLSPKTRYIELNGILSFCPDRYEDGEVEMVTPSCVQLLKQIETRAPQVETLVIKRNNPFFLEGVYTYLKDAEFNHDMVQSLMKMQNLNRLKVNLYSFHLNDLLKICKNLPRIQYINVGLLHRRVKDQPAPEDISSSFCNLKEFILECSAYDNNWLGTLCTRNLPNIEVVEFDPNRRMEWIDQTIFGNRYHGLNFSGASNLRHIGVDLLKDRAKEVEAMPNLFPKVTCLMVKNIIHCYPLADIVMKIFDNIRQLHLLNPYDRVVNEDCLITYGKKLQSLYLGHERESMTIDLESIFKYCPKLEKLSLLNVRFKTPPSSKIDFFAELQELEWVFQNHDYTPESHDLSDILSAPKLEKAKLEAMIFNEKDLWKLNSLIREKRILKNLHTLHVYFRFSFHEPLANVLRSACAFLPKLTDFKFGITNTFLDPLNAIQSTPLCDVEASVCDMIGVFENEN